MRPRRRRAQRQLLRASGRHRNRITEPGRSLCGKRSGAKQRMDCAGDGADEPGQVEAGKPIAQRGSDTRVTCCETGVGCDNVGTAPEQVCGRGSEIDAWGVWQIGRRAEFVSRQAYGAPRQNIDPCILLFDRSGQHGSDRRRALRFGDKPVAFASGRDSPLGSKGRQPRELAECVRRPAAWQLAWMGLSSSANPGLVSTR